MGALVGALYALGMSGEELAGLQLGPRLRSAIRPRLSRRGLLDPGPLDELVRALIGEKTFADAAIPLAVTAVDITRGVRVVVDEGPVAPAVVASMMVPSVYPPRRVAGQWLSDPGGFDPVPVDVAARFGSEAVVAVSADLPPAALGRWTPVLPPTSWLCVIAGNLCAALGGWARWPWARQLGWVLVQMGRHRTRYLEPSRIIWVQPAFGRMNANQFNACERAISLGQEAIDGIAPLLSSAHPAHS